MDSRIVQHNPGTSQIAAVERYAPGTKAGASLDIEQPAGSKTPCGVTRNMPLLDEGEIKLFSVLKAEAYVLWHDSLLPPEGSPRPACVCAFSQDGIFLAAGAHARERNEKDSPIPILPIR
jgi:hypothetical protein